MAIGWFMLPGVQIHWKQLVDGTEPKPVGWLGLAGRDCSPPRWLWALVTSLSILREARANEQQIGAAGADDPGPRSIVVEHGHRG